MFLHTLFETLQHVLLKIGIVGGNSGKMFLILFFEDKIAVVNNALKSIYACVCVGGGGILYRL